MLAKYLSVALAATLVSAQTHTECDPTKRDGCPNPKALGAKVIDLDLRKGQGDFVKPVAGTTLKTDSNLGTVYSISKLTDAPTVQSDKYIFFGEVHCTLRIAPGKGIVTSVVLQSDDLDEIDWEWLGMDNTRVQTNYFSKGCTETYDRGGFTPVTDPIGTFHTYSIIWGKDELKWQIDGTTVRTVQRAGTSGCSLYPQSPMMIKLGTWIGGHPDARPGTIEWAGGLADMSKAPFDSYYRHIRVVDYMGGSGAKDATEYVYTDRSGRWESIKVVNDGKQVGNDKSSSSSPTKTGDKPSTATTFTTAGTQAPVEPTGSSDPDASGTPSGSSPNASHTSGAGKVALTLGNASLMGAALVYFAL